MNTVANQTIIDRIAAAITAIEGSRLHYDPAVQDPTDGVFRPTESLSLHSDAMQLIHSRFPDGLYRHQHEAIYRILAGENTVVATRTSSGKSLIYSLPILNDLCSDSEATSLFLYPQKALANDQLLKLRELAGLMPNVAKLLGDRPHFISRYDGATPHADRPQIREEAQAILTNPDMLHYAMLQYHESH